MSTIVKAAVRLGAILLVRFANQFAGVIGFEILHYADSPRSLDVLLIFAHSFYLQLCIIKKHLACKSQIRC